MAQDEVNDWQSFRTDYERHLSKGSGAYIKATHVQDFLLRHITCLPQSKLLDVGCGDCWLGFATPLSEYYGIDINALPEGSSIGELRCESLYDMSFNEQMFDICVASMVLHLLDNLPEAFSRIFDVLKPGAQFAFVIPDPHFYNTGTVQSNGDFLLHANLKTAQRFEVSIGNVLPSMVYYYRSISTYLNEAVIAGFEFNGLYEEFIDLYEISMRYPDEKVAKLRTDKVPAFQLVKMSRPQ